MSDEFVSRLREAVDEDPRSKKEIAERAGCHPNQLTGWTRGHHSPGVDSVQRLARALGVDLNWLILGEDPSPTRELTGRLRRIGPDLKALVELAEDADDA